MDYLSGLRELSFRSGARGIYQGGKKEQSVLKDPENGKKSMFNTTEDKQHPAAFPAKALMMCKKTPTDNKNNPKCKTIPLEI